MNPSTTWWAVTSTTLVLVLYELLLLVLERRHPTRMARSVHATLREEWFDAVSAQTGCEILAVQTLRNSLMSATMLASTAALGLMGTVTLAAPSLHATFSKGYITSPLLEPRLALELLLLCLLFASLASTVMSVRFYNHAGFILAIPTESPARKRWAPAGRTYIRKAGVLYGIGLRQLVLVVPVVAAILSPVAGPLAAVAVVAVLLCWEHFSDSLVQPAE